MTIREASSDISEQLKHIYDEGEAASITEWVIDHLTGTRKKDRINQKQQEFTSEQQSASEPIIKRLLQHEPVQYVLNESWFCGLKFYVDKNVLIPRPETEELVEWIITNCKFPLDKLKILDIGSGSGCIPIALKRKLRKAEVWSCDISEAALNVARKNAETLGTDVNFIRLDFLDASERNNLPSFDIIVSNPPYVPQKDKALLALNVSEYEPATSLFVPDNDPLIFYTAIADFGKTHLNDNGAIYIEISENHGKEVMQLFQSNGYLTELKNDMQGKERMIKAGR